MQTLTTQKLTTQKEANARRREHTQRIVYIGLFVALIAVGAFVKVPIGIVPVSLQFAFCMLCALMLGWRDSMVCVLIYLILGLAGAPIFTKGGGIGYVFEPTFGYLLGFLPAAGICGLIARGPRGDAPISFKRFLLAAFVCMAIAYSFGVWYMYAIMTLYMHKSVAVSYVWLIGAAYFVPTDTMWCVIGSIVASKVLPRIMRRKSV